MRLVIGLIIQITGQLAEDVTSRTYSRPVGWPIQRMVLAAAAALISVIMIVAEVAIRYGQLVHITFADELSGYAFAFICFLAAADALREGSFIRLTFITRHLARKVQNVLMVLTYIVGLVVIGILAFQFWGYFKQTLEIGTISTSILRTPLFIPQVFVVIGAGFLWLQLFILTTREVVTPVTRLKSKSSKYD